MKAEQIYTLNWQGIIINISFKPDYFNSTKKILGTAISHLKIKALEPLPITSIGFKSLFLSIGEIEEEGDAISYIQNWLDASAKSEAWKQYHKAKIQLSLF
ncbi:MAG: hypothetical protein AAFR87_33970 [Bacteroidota bacterium]